MSASGAPKEQARRSLAYTAKHAHTFHTPTLVFPAGEPLGPGGPDPEVHGHGKQHLHSRPHCHAGAQGDPGPTFS